MFSSGITGLGIARYNNAGLVSKVLAVRVDNELWDATRPIHQDTTVQLLTWDDEAGKRVFWHSSAHLLAEALEALYLGIKFGTGPAIQHGFYCDVDFGNQSFEVAHLEK